MERHETELLVVRAQLGDREALAELVRDWHQAVAEYARRMLTADLAEDVGQETWLAVVRGLPGLREPERFAPWLFTIARRVVMNQLRDRYSEALVPSAEVEPDPSDALLDRVVVLRWLEELPMVEREVLVLFHLQDLSLDECAEVLGVPVGTVKSRLYRARRMIRVTADKEGGRP